MTTKADQKKDPDEREKHVLDNPDIFPDESVLAQHLGLSISAFNGFVKLVNGVNAQMEWRFYKDGKAWLCKTTLKKITLCWLSAAKNCFYVTFYFTDKHNANIRALDIDEGLKKTWETHKGFGKLKPMTLAITSKKDLQNLENILHYKIGCK